PLGSSMAEFQTNSSRVFSTRNPAVFTIRLMRLASRSCNSSFRRSVPSCSLFSYCTERQPFAIPPSFTCRIISSICSAMGIASHQAIVNGKIGIVVQHWAGSQLQWVRPVFLFRNHVVALAQAVRLGSPVLCGQLQWIAAKLRIAVVQDFDEKLQGAVAVFALRRGQVRLPFLLPRAQ